MNFGFSEEQELLRKTARDFLAEHAPMKRVREVMEGESGYATEVWGQMAELGWIGLALPESLGGAGLSLIELVLVVEELGRSLTPVPFLPTVIAGDAILSVGNDDQKTEWLTRIAAGRAIASLAITEARGTEEPGDLKVSASESGGNSGGNSDGSWTLNGEKLFVPDADVADVLVVVARTGGAGESGLGAFLVPATLQAFTSSPCVPWTCSATCTGCASTARRFRPRPCWEAIATSGPGCVRCWIGRG